MALLTDQIQATGVTPNDLIHIVITGDTSQNPAGSSYKASISQVLSLVSGSTGGSEGYYGQFYINSNLCSPTSGVANLVQFSGTDYSNGVILTSNTKTNDSILFQNTGKYHLSLRANFNNGDASTQSSEISTYVGGNLIGSAISNINVPPNGGYASMEFENIIDVTAGDLMYFLWETSNISNCLAFTVGASTGYSLTVNVHNISEVLSGASGTSGTSGSSGSSGSSGTSGSSGSSGSSGTSGSSGINPQGLYLPLSGGTVTGGTIYQSGLTANTLNISTTPTTDTSLSANYLTRDGSTGEIKVKTIPGPTVFGLYAQTGNSVVVSATTTESTLIGGGIGSLSVPANGFQVGDSFRVIMGGAINAGNNEDIRIRIKSGSVVLADSLMQNLVGSTNDVWALQLDFTIRTTGTTGVASIVTLGVFNVHKTSNSASTGFSFNTVNNTTFDTTSSNTLDITVEWDTTSISNSIYSDIFVLNKVF